VKVTEVNIVSKRLKIRFVGYDAQFEEWRFFDGDKAPEHKQLLSNAISRTEFVSNVGTSHTKLRKFPLIFNSGGAFIAEVSRSGVLWVRKCGKLPIRENLAIT